MQGLAATESAMIRSAEIAAEKGDFDGAKGWLAAAAKVRPEMSTVPDAVVRIERLRSARIARLRDLGVAALGQPEGIATARRRLAEILLIEIGRASCRARVCQYVSISVVAESLKKKHTVINKTNTK